MRAVPGRGEATRALRGAVRAVKSSLGRVNREAGKLVAQGRYEDAEAVLEIGRSLNEFSTQLEGLLSKWRDLTVGKASRKADRAPLWEYYRPLLRILADVGDLTTLEILTKTESALSATLRDGDYAQMANGQLRWKNMVRRAKRAMTKESFLEPKTGSRWVITASGRRAAKKKDSRS